MARAMSVDDAEAASDPIGALGGEGDGEPVSDEAE